MMNTGKALRKGRYSSLYSTKKFLVHYSVPLSPSSLVSLIFIALLILASIAIAIKFPFILQHDPIHLARGLASKYPDVGLPSPKEPTIVDPNLKAEVVFRGLRYPTSMTFLGPNDILVTEKDAGTVQRVVNGIELQQALLNVSVATYGHRGMLGIAIAPPTTAASSINHGVRNNITYVLYTTLRPKHILVMISQKENNHWVIAYTDMS